jgi:hypothetical protein
MFLNLKKYKQNRKQKRKTEKGTQKRKEKGNRNGKLNYYTLNRKNGPAQTRLGGVR